MLLLHAFGAQTDRAARLRGGVAALGVVRVALLQFVLVRESLLLVKLAPSAARIGPGALGCAFAVEENGYPLGSDSSVSITRRRVRAIWPLHFVCIAGRLRVRPHCRSRWCLSCTFLAFRATRRLE